MNICEKRKGTSGTVSYKGTGVQRVNRGSGYRDVQGVQGATGDTKGQRGTGVNILKLIILGMEAKALTKDTQTSLISKLFI